jgi:hypothetical protein
VKRVQDILRRYIIAVAAVCICASGGCGGSPTSQMKAIMRRMYDCNGKRLAVLYGRYMNRPLDSFPGSQGFSGPANEKEFKEFIVSMSEAALAEFGVSPPEVDALFVGEQSKSPLDVRYGVSGDLSTRYHVVFEPLADGVSTRVFAVDGTSFTIPTAEVDSYRSGEKDTKVGSDGPGTPATNERVS